MKYTLTLVKIVVMISNLGQDLLSENYLILYFKYIYLSTWSSAWIHDAQTRGAWNKNEQINNWNVSIQSLIYALFFLSTFSFARIPTYHFILPSLSFTRIQIWKYHYWRDSWASFRLNELFSLLSIFFVRLVCFIVN